MIVTVTEEKKDIIREIFWDMNELSKRTEVEYPLIDRFHTNIQTFS